MGIFSFNSKDLGIDLGTSNILVTIIHKVAINAPSIKFVFLSFPIWHLVYFLLVYFNYNKKVRLLI